MKLAYKKLFSTTFFGFLVVCTKALDGSWWVRKRHSTGHYLFSISKIIGNSGISCYTIILFKYKFYIGKMNHFEKKIA